MFRIRMPEAANKIIKTLNKAGYEAYIVGGCVRDALLNKEPADWDITTSANPEEIKALFRRTIDTGIQHGTVTVMDGKVGYEVTTYRVDGVYSDHRRPNSVTFTKSLEEDLKRRDFTINAMAYNETEGLIDIFDGEKDLREGIIRCVGVASERFDEDALRILRAVRFAAQLGFVIEEETKEAIKKQCKFLKDISAERIQVEMTKMLTSNHPERIIDAYALGITNVILPEFDQMMACEQNNKYHCYTVGMHAVKVVESIEAKPYLRWAALLHDVGKMSVKTTDLDGVDHFYGHGPAGVDIGKAVLKRMRLDNDTIKKVERLILWHDYGLGDDKITPLTMRKMLYKMGPDLLPDLIKIKYADCEGQSDYKKEEKLSRIKEIETEAYGVLGRGECISLKQLAVDGKDLMENGIKEGKMIGDTLHKMLDYVIQYPEKNTKEDLYKLIPMTTEK